MTSVRHIAILMLWAALAAPAIHAQDLSRYREFQFGAGLPAIAKQVRMQPAEARVIHRRPAVIQELEWRPPISFASSPRAESVRDILFSFYNGELFRIVVTYDPERTAGMTAEDLVEAVSAKYGTATRPVAEVALSSTQLYGDEKTYYDRSEKVIARWADAQYSFDLFQPSAESAFGLALYAKRLDALARSAIVEAIRLDAQEAPQREIERQHKKDGDDRAKQAKARRANKAPFRP